MTKETGSEDLGFKELTPSNWRDPDPVNAQFGRVSPVVGPVTMDGDDWARAFLAVRLDAQVPREVHQLFAVAQGALLYGWFFYPLYRLGEEQLHRVVEAAVAHRYRQLAGPKSQRSLAQRIEWLLNRQVIPPAEAERWHALRHLRNYSSHPQQQAVMPPGAVLTVLKAAAWDINVLYRREPVA